MGLTYLVLLDRDGDITLLLRTQDEAAAERAYEAAVQEERKELDMGYRTGDVYLTTVRAEARLS